MLDKITVLNVLFIPETHQLEVRVASKVIRAALAIAQHHRALYILDPHLSPGNQSTTATWLAWLSRQKAIRHPNVTRGMPQRYECGILHSPNAHVSCRLVEPWLASGLASTVPEECGKPRQELKRPCGRFNPWNGE